MHLTFVLHQIHLSYSGSGSLLVYQFGASKCLLQHGEKLLRRVKFYAGTSSGALVAALMSIRPEKIDEILPLAYHTVQEVHKKPLGMLTPGYTVITDIQRVLNEFLPEDAHLIARKKIHVSITSLSNMQNMLINDFHSREELIQCLTVSCFIPVYCGVILPKFRNMICIDGCYTSNLPRFPKGRTIVVTPFSGEQDISPVDPGDWPKVYFKSQMFAINKLNAQRLYQSLFPPAISELEKYYQQGYNDAVKFLKKENLYENA